MVKVTLPNGDNFSYTIIYKEYDSLNGNIIAVFFGDTSVVAFKEGYYNGKPNGVFLYYYPNGNYRQTMVYGYGELHGDYTVYNDFGEVIKKGKYKDGLKQGYWRDLTLNLTGRYHKGERHLKWKLIDPHDKDSVYHWRYNKGQLRKGNIEKANLLRL